MIKLAEYYRTLPKKDLLLNLKVWDTWNNRFFYIISVEGGLWCSLYKDSEEGYFFDMDRLMIDLDDLK